MDLINFFFCVCVFSCLSWLHILFPNNFFFLFLKIKRNKKNSYITCFTAWISWKEIIYFLFVWNIGIFCFFINEFILRYNNINKLCLVYFNKSLIFIQLFLNDDCSLLSSNDSMKIDVKMLPKTLIFSSLKAKILIFQPGKVRKIWLYADDESLST